MTQFLSEYIDSLIFAVKKGGSFSDAVFYRSYDGVPAPSEPDGFSVCVGIGKYERRRRFLSIYKKREHTLINAELTFRVSAPADAGGLSVFCERLESALRLAAGGEVLKSSVSAAAYSADLNAVYRLVTLNARLACPQL